MEYAYDSLNKLQASLDATGVVSDSFRRLIIGYAMGVAQEAHANGRRQGQYEGEFEREHKDTLVTKGIVRRDGSMGGQPRIWGTRITAEMVANLMSGDQPMGWRSIIESYPTLTYADIQNVKEWDRKGRPDGIPLPEIDPDTGQVLS